MDLDPIPWRPTRYPGVSIHFYASDRRSGRALALIRMEPGCGYPEHRHRGEEHVLVLQGGYRDDSGTHLAGQFVIHEDRSVHEPIAVDGPGAVPCVLLALAHEGVVLASQE
ncbi:MAG: cupin domain-containing protein [Planctomycetes bacterium]|jgi:anti-sigma factor ChrR (cupin superfamily)|nr:cupin domain-containing protein [Planctomycetota bacterium]